jgi:hypothetical protein
MDLGHATSSGGLTGSSRRGRARLSRQIMAGMLSGALMIMGASASAALLIDFGDQTLLPNTPGQSVAITISNDGAPVPLGAFELFIQVADGGPEWAAGSIPGPRIEAVNLLTGTPFESNNLGGQFGSLDNLPQRQFWGVVGSPTLPTGSDQLLATVTFDTTGFDAGTWDVFLTGSPLPTSRLLNPQSDPYAVTIMNGTLTVVPEPSATATAIGCLLLSGLLARTAMRRLGGA